MIQLTKHAWTRLYKEVLLLVLRLTHTKDPKLQYTARDRAQEAVQRAWERYLRLDPPGLETVEAVRAYVVAAARGELWNTKERARARREVEKEAMIDQAVTLGASAPSSEAASLEHAQQQHEQRDGGRPARWMRALRKKLAGDPIALGTIDCIAKKVTEPHEQAKALGVPVEAIYNARKRRNRAMEQVVAEDRAVQLEETN